MDLQQSGRQFDLNPRRKRRLSGWIIFAGLLTVIYVGLGLWFIWPVQQPFEIAGFLMLLDQLHALKLNEFGDLLSGFFAPLALLWLATAVLVQSQELKAQRQALELTRQVAVATHDQIADQAASLKAQTAVLQDQFEEQKRRSADEEFSRLLDQLQTLLQTRIDSRRAVRIEGEAKFTMLLIQRPPAGERNFKLAGYSDVFVNAAEHYAKGAPGGLRFEMSPAMARSVEDLGALAENLVSRIPDASTSTHVLVRTIRLYELQGAVEEIRRSIQVGPA